MGGSDQNTLIEELRADITRFKSREEELRAEITTMNSQENDQNTLIEKLTADINTSKSREEELRTQLASVALNDNETENERMEWKKRIVELEENAARFQSQRDALQREISGMNSEKEAEIASFKEILRNQERECHEREAECSELRSSLSLEEERQANERRLVTAARDAALQDLAREREEKQMGANRQPELDSCLRAKTRELSEMSAQLNDVTRKASETQETEKTLKASAERNESVVDRLKRRLHLFSDEIQNQHDIEQMIEDMLRVTNNAKLQNKHLATMVDSLRTDNEKLKCELKKAESAGFFQNVGCKWMFPFKPPPQIAMSRFAGDGL